MDLEMLKIVDPMTSDCIRESVFVDVRKYKHIRITSFSDCELGMQIIFSYNGISEGPMSQYQLIPNNWTTRRVDIILPFIKIRVIKAEEQVNKMIVINALGRFTPIESIQPVKENEDNDVPKDEPKDGRSKSPFRSWVGKKINNSNHNPSQKIQVNDPRLPDYISRNSLLIGGYSNSVILIPPPVANTDSHLCWIDNTFCWQSINEPKKTLTWKI
jgi:hypothetical protein